MTTTAALVHEERIELAGVPARVYRPEGAQALLLYGHGAASSKDDPSTVGPCRAYAERTGLAVVCIDAPQHGERAQRRLFAKYRKIDWLDLRRKMLTSAPQIADDWRNVVGSLSDIGPAVAYVGFSMGAMFAASIVPTMPTIRTVVLSAGGIPADAPDPSRFLAFATALADRHLFMMNMTEDPLFPPPLALEFFAAVPGHDKRIAFWACGHNDHPEDAVEMAADFIRWCDA